MSLFFLEDKQNVKFGGVVRGELYIHFECAFHVFSITQMPHSHPIH